jgi:diguanylate cyclase (GGDEF)-like protein/putative nucleotidyltransferase with HDIG domain
VAKDDEADGDPQQAADERPTLFPRRSRRILMGQYAPAARAWVRLVALAAISITVLGLQPFTATLADWSALGLLATCAAVAHVFPIRSAADGASYRMTSIFVIAAAAILPPGLLSLVAVAAISPENWLRRRSSGLAVRWLFDVAVTTVAAHAAGGLVRWTGSQQMSDAYDLIVLVGAAALFTLAQAALEGVATASNARTPIAQVNTFALPALVSDGLLGLLGVLVAGLWLAKPELLALVPALLLMAHRLTRSAHLAHLAQVDSKTGLYNSRFFERALEEALAHSLRAKQPLALLFVDVDFLRRVNNQYGHLAGDRVLQEIAGLLAGAVRKGDLIARFGGEEFVILLPGADIEEAAYRAEQLRNSVQGHRIVLDDATDLRCTISIGVAACPDHGTDVAGLIKQADDAMYRAKQIRNAVARPRSLPLVPRLPEPAVQPPGVPPAGRPYASAQDPTGRGGAEGEGAAPARASARTRRGPQGRGAPEAGMPPLMLWGTIVAGLLVTGWTVLEVHQAAGWLTLLPFLPLAVGAEFLRVRVYEANRQVISLSFMTAVTMAAMTIQPLNAPLVSLAGALVHLALTRQWHPNAVLAAIGASQIYLLARPAEAVLEPWHPAAALAAVLTLYVTNVGIVSLMISLHSGRALAEVVREAAWFSPTNILLDLLLGLTGAFLGGAHAQLGLLGAVMVIVPVLLMRVTLAFYARRSRQAIETLRAAKAEAEQAHEEKEETLRKLIETVASIIDARDQSVSGHSHQVARYAVALGRELGLNAGELAMLHTAGLFHDLGKVGIPEAILHKPARLTDEEYQVIKQHAAIGERILSEVRQLEVVARMVGEHHERYDGSGYPKGKRRHAIHIGGRILGVADALDSILSNRPYSQGKELACALEELDRCAGTHFDPEVVAALHRLVDSRGPAFFRASPDHATVDEAVLELVA